MNTNIFKMKFSKSGKSRYTETKNMKQLIFLIICCTPLIMQAQHDSTYKGIRWTNPLSWESLIQKAKRENKYIFLNVYADWCIPCKNMEKEVYSKTTVGDYINDKFIPLKVQVDSLSDKLEQNIKLCNEGKTLNREYQVTSLPAYLFFSPTGAIVHKGLGAMSESEFIELASNALGPTTQYYTLLNEYQKGKTNCSTIASLARQNKILGQNDAATILAKEYKDSYLDTLSIESLCKKDNIEFIAMFPDLINSSDGFFNLFYNNSTIVDNIMNREGFSKYFVECVIAKEEITNKLCISERTFISRQTWNRIRLNIAKKYNERYAESLVIKAQQSFYKRIGNWKKYSKTVDIIIKKYPPTIEGKNLSKMLDGFAFIGHDAWGLNYVAWDAFLYCENKNVLSKALMWTKISINLEKKESLLFQYYDTKANLLYKIGKVKQAIFWETKAIELESVYAKKQGNVSNKSSNGYNKTIMKMKNRQPTWIAHDEEDQKR